MDVLHHSSSTRPPNVLLELPHVQRVLEVLVFVHLFDDSSLPPIQHRHEFSQLFKVLGLLFLITDCFALGFEWRKCNASPVVATTNPPAYSSLQSWPVSFDQQHSSWRTVPALLHDFLSPC